MKSRSKQTIKLIKRIGMAKLRFHTTDIAGVVSAVLGAEMTGAIIGGGGVIGLVSVFILGRKTNKIK